MSSSTIVISAFGRGNWLASEIAGIGEKVDLVDVSSIMGRWAPEDWEGPFGFFHSENIKVSQLERLNEEDYYEPIDEGFTIWLRNGPIDMKGPLAAHILQQVGLKDITEEYLLGSSAIPDSEELIKSGFEKTWLVFMAYHLASNRFLENNFDISKDMSCLPLFSPLNVRRVSRRGAEKSLDWCEAQGVVVHRNAVLDSMQIEDKKIKSISLTVDGENQVHECNQLVWMLTSEETQRLPKDFSSQLFSGGTLSSSWNWLRYRLQLGAETDYTSSLPIKFLMVNDLYLPWCHENLVLVQRTVNEKHIDAWLRVPNSKRYQREYLKSMGDKLKELFRERIPDSDPQVIDMPQDYIYDDAELGPSRFPIYNPMDLKKHKPNQYKNLYYENPEVWSPQDWSGQFASQLKTFEKIKKMKQQRESSKRQEVHP